MVFTHSSAEETRSDTMFPLTGFGTSLVQLWDALKPHGIKCTNVFHGLFLQKDLWDELSGFSKQIRRDQLNHRRLNENKMKVNCTNSQVNTAQQHSCWNPADWQMNWGFSCDSNTKEWHENKVQGMKVKIRNKGSDDKSQTGNTRSWPSK